MQCKGRRASNDDDPRTGRGELAIGAKGRNDPEVKKAIDVGGRETKRLLKWPARERCHQSCRQDRSQSRFRPPCGAFRERGGPRPRRVQAPSASGRSRHLRGRTGERPRAVAARVLEASHPRHGHASLSLSWQAAEAGSLPRPRRRLRRCDDGDAPDHFARHHDGGDGGGGGAVAAWAKARHRAAWGGLRRRRRHSQATTRPPAASRAADERERTSPLSPRRLATL